MRSSGKVQAAAGGVLAAVLMLSSCGSGSNGAGGGGQAETESAEETAAEVDVPMPDLVGLTEDEARAELLERAVDASDVEVEYQESLDDPGTVISTVPGEGRRITGSVTMVVAQPVGEVPDFVGEQVSAVREWADERGIDVTEVAVPDDDLPEGQVTGTTPRAGAEATSELVVMYATNPLVVPLADLQSANDPDCNVDFGVEASVNGEFVQDSITVQSSRFSNPECVLEYNLRRDWDRLMATVGVGDDSDTSAQYRVQVFGDDNELWNQVLGFAGPQPLDVDVTRVLRLRVVVTTLVPDVQGEAVLGDARLIGDKEKVPSTTATT